MTAAIIYQRPLSPLGQWPESVCADNPHEYYTGKDTAVPTADKPDFPATSVLRPRRWGKIALLAAGDRRRMPVDDPGAFNIAWSAIQHLADINNPNLTQFAKDSLKKTNDEVLAGKPMWSRSSRCWATRFMQALAGAAVQSRRPQPRAR